VRRYLDSRCQPVAATADGRFRKSTNGERKPVQIQRILCVTAVELEMHKTKKNETLIGRLRFVKVKHTNVTLDAHRGGSQ